VTSKMWRRVGRYLLIIILPGIVVTVIGNAIWAQITGQDFRPAAKQVTVCVGGFLVRPVPVWVLAAAILGGYTACGVLTWVRSGKRGLVFRQGVWWPQGRCRAETAYCSHCLDVNRKRVQLTRYYDGTGECPHCRAHYPGVWLSRPVPGARVIT
jgi:hypothetical protein